MWPAVYRTAGRKGARWQRCRLIVLARSDICCWCGHPGAGDANHDLGLEVARSQGLANNPDYCSPIHGAFSPCPYCPARWSPKFKRLVQPNCNAILGARPLEVALAERASGVSRDW